MRGPSSPSVPQEPPGQGALPCFSGTAIANPAACALLLALLRRAAPEDQLWGVAALKELLLQGVHNLAAADSAGLNGQLIAWLRDATAQAGAAAEDAAPAEQQDALGPRQHLVAQLLALLRVSGTYSIAGKALARGKCTCCASAGAPRMTAA